MTREEFAKWAMAMRSYYPNQNLLPTKQATELWFRQLEDIPYNVAVLSLNRWVATNKWAPTIADVREATAECINEPIPDWSEAWQEVMRVISYYGSWNVEEGKSKLTGITRETVNRMGYMRLCSSENITADRANFRDIYEILARRKRQERQMPARLLEAIGTVRAGMIEEKEGNI